MIERLQRSTGERQRVQLARAVRNRTTGVLHVLDEPSIGLHPHNLKGLTGVMDDLRTDGNSVIIVDHDTRVLKHADWMIEMGQGAGADGGTVIAEGRIANIAKNPRSVIGPYLSDRYEARIRPITQADRMFDKGAIHLETGMIHTVHPLDVRIPMGRLTVVTGVSGPGKTTMVLESLIPALRAKIGGQKLAGHVRNIEAEGIAQVKLIDATPIGINVRSTVATYANVHDELRKAYAKTQDAKDRSLKARDFSYNTGDSAARPVTEQGRSRWTSSSCPMRRFPARTAGVPGTARMLSTSAGKRRTAMHTVCRSS